MGNTKAFPLGGGSGGGAASSIVIGNPVTGGGASRVLYEDASQNLAASASLSFDGTTLESSLQTNISGPDATTNVEIGSTANDANAGTGGTSVVIGNAAANGFNGTGAVIIGSSAVVTTGGGVDSVIIGRIATVTNANSAVAIGAGANAANAALAIGTSANAAASSFAIGNGSTAAANEFVSGSNTVAINNAYFGKGKVSATATAFTINGTGGSGSDNAGAALNLAGGKGTGLSAGGNVVLQASQRLATGSTAQTLYDRHVVVAGTKALTAGAATGVVRIGVPQGLTGPVGVTVYYSVRAADATDFQLRRGSVHIAAVNKAGAETGVISAASEVLDGSVLAQSSASTLTYALTVTSNSSDTVDFEINAVSGLTETTLDVQYTVLRDHGTGTIAAL